MMKKMALVSALITAFSICQTDVHAEAQYNMELKIETLEIPVNWYVSGEEINVPIYVNNNPGINSISFMLKKGDNIDNKISAYSKEDLIPFRNFSNTYFSEDRIDTRVSTIDKQYGPYYDQNGILGYIIVVLPDNISVGDFYSIEFGNECIKSEEDIGFYKDQTFYGKENFTYINGGIKIVEEKPMYQQYDPPAETVQNAPSASNQQSQQEENIPVNNISPQSNSSSDNITNQNSSNDNNNNSGGENAKTQTKITVTSVITKKPDVTTIISKEKTATDKKTETSKSTVTSVKTDISTETGMTSSEQSEVSSDTEKESQSKKSSRFIPAIVAAAILLIGGIGYVIVKKKRKNKI